VCRCLLKESYTFWDKRDSCRNNEELLKKYFSFCFFSFYCSFLFRFNNLQYKKFIWPNFLKISTMKKIKIIAGIIWAFLCLFLIIILFPGLNSFSSSVSRLPFMKINPRYSGGEAAGQFITPGCTLVIRKPVFNGLFKERNTGFIQLDWRGTIPEEIIDTIDFNMDDIPDFRLHINTKGMTAHIDPVNSKVSNILISTPTSYGWSVRVELNK
jgi:hypothetical protein